MYLDDFDIDATTGDAWAAFTANLAEVLSVMDDSSDLNISVARGLVAGEAPAITFTASGPKVIARIVSGWSAPDAQDPAEDEIDRLLEMGWHEPREGEQAYFAECDQEDTQPLASLTASTMQEIFDVIHPVFLEPDQLKELLSGREALQAVPPKPEDAAVLPANRAELDRLVDQQLVRHIGYPPLRNPEGDVAIRVGSSVVFLRSTPDAAELMLFAPLVHEVSGRSRACEVLNDLNVESRYGRFALHRDRVYVQLAVPAKPFVPAHLHQALRIVSQIADGIDDELASKLGGRTTFPV